MIIIDIRLLSLAHGLGLAPAIFGDGHPDCVPLQPGCVGTYLLYLGTYFL